MREIEEEILKDIILGNRGHLNISNDASNRPLTLATLLETTRKMCPFRTFMVENGYPPEEGWKMAVSPEAMKLFGVTGLVFEGRWKDFVYVNACISGVLLFNPSMAGMER